MGEERGGENQTTTVCPSGLTRHEYIGETCMLCNLTVLQLPLSLHFPGAAAQPQLWGMMSTVLQHSRVKCIVHARGALSFEYSTSLEI